MDRENGIGVLIVEDNPGDAKIITELFRDIKNGAGFRLSFSETLSKAAAAAAHDLPDIILLDLNLPDSYGPATLGKAETLFPELPIIIMTGFYEEHLGLELIKKGAQDYLVKGKITGDWLAYSIKYSIERFKIERKLKQRESRLEDILEKSPDGVMVTRKDGRVLFANHGAEAIFGHKREDLLKHAFTLEADSEKTVETELRRLDGRKMPLEVRAVETVWDSEPCRLVLLRDLTPVRTLQRNRDEFISMISHELRSPLSVVKESLDLVYDGSVGDINAKQKEILKIGTENCTRLNRLIDALLDITKIEAGVMPMDIAKADLGLLLEETEREYGRLAEERSVRLAMDLPKAPLFTYCDKEKVREVIINLVTNAIKFTPRGGVITLSLRPWEGEALLCVEDTGPGIEADDIPRLFNKFSQVGRRRPPGVKGTGLGLAICKGIVELHGGRVWVESEPPKGSKFYVLLPVLPFDAALKGLVRREIELALAHNYKFCVVDINFSGAAVKAGPRAHEFSARAEKFIKSNMRNCHAVLKREEGDFTLILSNADPREGCRACSFVEKGLADIAGLAQGEASGITLLLSFPGDFRDEEAFIRKLAEGREKANV
ncbi:MAG: ATP-binding protein [Elusimicrobiales bacterium]|nr:ATP-binding protein [Elusimicrobiales bacterium]